VHGLKRLQPDPSAALIWLLEKLGLVWDVVRIPPERQAAKAAA
jgi:stearoyl-CoA desaturase (delta-9 desaturase)